MEFFEAHAFALSVALGVTILISLRGLVWKFARPVRTCDTCEYHGAVRRIVPGAWWVEYPVIAVGLTVGFFVHVLLVAALVMFLWRTLASYKVCAKCGSERLLKGDPRISPA